MDQAPQLAAAFPLRFLHIFPHSPKNPFGFRFHKIYICFTMFYYVTQHSNSSIRFNQFLLKRSQTSTGFPHLSDLRSLAPTERETANPPAEARRGPCSGATAVASASCRSCSPAWPARRWRGREGGRLGLFLSSVWRLGEMDWTWKTSNLIQKQEVSLNQTGF